MGSLRGVPEGGVNRNRRGQAVSLHEAVPPLPVLAGGGIRTPTQPLPPDAPSKDGSTRQATLFLGLDSLR